MKDELKNIAEHIFKLENKLQSGKSEKSIEDEIERIMCSLSIEEMIEIDNYIMSEKNI